MEFHSEMVAVMGDDPKITPLKTVSVGVRKGASVICSAKGTCKPIEESENNSQSTINSTEVACEKVKKCVRGRMSSLICC